MQLGRKVVLGAVGGEEHRVLGNSMKLKKKRKTTSCVLRVGCSPVQTLTLNTGAEGFSPFTSQYCV
jgi:hypothetical protein